ncbi:MAG: hypothetical protein IPJ81_06170 [Chitinophagaceae bacterium]|jgi:hypothetical protein|nr:hypothetical protein [Chitinophagaceae bacterium]
MKRSNQVFIAFGKRFNSIGKRWAAWMSKKEIGISPKRKKLYLIWFVTVMVLLLWVPLFLKKNNSVINVGSIKPPIELNRNNYASQSKKLDYLIDSVRKDSIKFDSIKNQFVKKRFFKN